MVLEGATASSDADFIQDAPSSDSDPYATETPDSASRNGQPSALVPGQALNYSIDLDKIPKPFGFFGMNESFPKPALDALRDQMTFATGIVNRPLTQDEVDGLAYNFGKCLRISSFGIPAGMTIGLVQAARTMDKFSFPFFTPKEGSYFNPEKFGPLRGQLAKSAWQVVRFNLYGFAGIIFAQLFFSSYAISIDAAVKASDPRLENYRQALRQRMKEGGPRQPLQLPPTQNSNITTQEGGMDSQAQKAQNTLQRSRDAMAGRRQDSARQSRRQEADDDMSPTSGAWARENADISSDTGLLSDTQMREQEKASERRNRLAEMATEKESRATASSYSQTSSTTQDLDDASPRKGQQPAKKPYPTGSAWERIRQESAAAQNQALDQSRDQTLRRSGGQSGRGSLQQEQRQGSTIGDSFSFSETDEQRQLAKMEAQRDFDARVEKERQGGDFSESGRGRKW